MPQRRHSRNSDSLLAQTRRLLRRYNLRARKGLGQHFLIDQEVLEKIVTAAELTSVDVVLEIGPGLGILTGEMAERAGWVIAVELDNKLAAILKQTLAAQQNITIINEDILGINPAILFEEHKGEFPVEIATVADYKVVANLPYYITAPVLRHFLEAEVKPAQMIIMVQREVAEDIVARPQRRSLLSVSVQLYGEPEIIDYVPARCFYPPPEVDSAILKVTSYAQPAIDIDDREGFFTVVRAGFSASRKQIGNSLALGLEMPKSEALSILARAEISAQRRAETLTLEEWVRLYRTVDGRNQEGC